MTNKQPETKSMLLSFFSWARRLTLTLPLSLLVGSAATAFVKTATGSDIAQPVNREQRRALAKAQRRKGK